MNAAVPEAAGAEGEEPLFSVITIFHNEERFLADAVASVASQVGPSWELILVDDGSTDRSGEIARMLASSFPGWIRCLTHPDGHNHGMSASRNLGINAARGRWITFLDADDTWSAGKLAAQHHALERNGSVKVLVSPACWWWSWNPNAEQPDWIQELPTGHRPQRSGIERDDPVRSTIVEPPVLVAAFLQDEWKSICDVVVHRDVIAEIGGYEPTFAGMFEDQVFHIKLLSRYAAVVTGNSWYRYRQHDGACTATAHAAGGHLRSRQAFLDWAFRYLNRIDHPVTVTTSEWQALNMEVRQQRRTGRWRLMCHRLPKRPPWLP